MSEQTGFLFDGPLLHDPVSQLPPPAPVVVTAPLPDAVRDLIALPGDELVSCLVNIAATMPEDIDYDDLLAAAGFPPQAVTGWHRSRAREALMPPRGEYQAYQPSQGKVRFKRLQPCPGFEGRECSALTGGGVLCRRCRLSEEEDLFNQE